jgi:hypothetical protein
MIFQVIWKASLHFGYYVIYKGEKRFMRQCFTGLVFGAVFSRWTGRPTRRFGFKSTSTIWSALLLKQSNYSSLRFVFSNCIKVLVSSKAEVSYFFHRNDVDRLQTITVDIKRIHSVDIVSIGIEIYIIYFSNKIFA